MQYSLQTELMRAWTKFIGAFLLCVSSVFAQEQKEKPLDTIRAALASRDFDHAVELTRTALRASPNNARLWTFQGIALAGKGDNSKALVSFKQALKIDPNNLGALAGAAQSAYATNDDAEAVPLLNHLLRLRPDEPTANAMLAVLEYREGNCAGAAAHFEKAGEVIRSQIDGLNAFGICLVKLKKLDQAEAVFGQAVALDPEDGRERHLLASLQIMARKPQDALATLKPLLDVGDPSADTLQLASAAYEDSGDTPKAVETLRQAILREPRNVSLYLDFANISFAHESFQVGIDVISEGLTLQPKSADLYVARGVLYVQLAQYDQAEADFERAQELDPTHSLGAAAQGLAALQENDLDHALATVQSKLKQNPNDSMLLYLQADVLSQKGADSGTPEFRLALRSAERAIKLRPTLAAAREVLAKLYMQTGQYQEAADQCRKALVSDPKDQTALYRLIQALRKMGNKEEIPALLKRLASLREEAAKEERERYRYKLIEEAEPAKP
jgi:tetratricopeptide (TPR) repeat protein